MQEAAPPPPLRCLLSSYFCTFLDCECLEKRYINVKNYVVFILYTAFILLKWLFIKYYIKHFKVCWKKTST